MNKATGDTMNESELQQNFDILSGRTNDKAAELAACKGELSAIVGQLVDADKKARPGLIARRAEMVNMAGLLADELQELASRRDAAELAIYELRESLAEAEAMRLDAISRDARQAMIAAADAVLHYINRRGRQGQTADDARDLVNLEAEKARTAAESAITRRNTERAAAIRDQVKAETVDARRRLLFRSELK